MPPRKSQLTKEQQKQAKQKKMLLLLVPVLAVLAIVQGPKLMKAVGGDSAETSAAATTGAADTGAADTGLAATTPASTEPGSTIEAPVAVPTGPVTLVDSDLPPAADEDQLVAFDRFAGKDPFRQQVTPPAQDQPAKGDKPSEDGADDGANETLLDSAVLVVNDVVESVKVSGAFPADDPTFRLVAVDGSGKTISIGLVSGSFSTGAGTIELAAGETLTLVSQPDGVRYEIKLKKLTASSGA